jgi:hypothetical protein
MSLAKLSLQTLEGRENPSVPGLDPFGGLSPAPHSPGPPAAVPPPQPALPRDQGFFERVAIGVENEAFRKALYPLLEDNSIYKTPLVLPALPK